VDSGVCCEAHGWELQLTFTWEGIGQQLVTTGVLAVNKLLLVLHLALSGGVNCFPIYRGPPLIWAAFCFKMPHW
jgi:hypothetical protein